MRSPSYTAWVDTDPIAADTGGDRVGVGVRSADDLVVHGEALAGDLQTRVVQGLGVGMWRRRHRPPTQSHKLERVKKRGDVNSSSTGSLTRGHRTMSKERRGTVPRPPDERGAMSNKSPQKHNAKKTGKSLKDKRLEKKAKKADKTSVL